MTLIIEDPEIDRLADEVAKRTGESPAEILRQALMERLEREQSEQAEEPGLAERLDEIAKHCASLPDLDTRSPDEIIEYDEYGLPS